jgi:hypothetical protein
MDVIDITEDDENNITFNSLMEIQMLVINFVLILILMLYFIIILKINKQ